MNSAASRAYYAMFQAGSHPALQAAFTTELIHRRKAYPAALRDHLSVGLGVRQAADYGRAGVSRKVAHRMVRRAAGFVSIVEEGTTHGPKS